MELQALQREADDVMQALSAQEQHALDKRLKTLQIDTEKLQVGHNFFIVNLHDYVYYVYYVILRTFSSHFQDSLNKKSLIL